MTTSQILATEHNEAVRQGVYDAFADILHVGIAGAPDYPISRDVLLEAVTEGVRQAVSEAIEAGSWPPTA